MHLKLTRKKSSAYAKRLLSSHHEIGSGPRAVLRVPVVIAGGPGQLPPEGVVDEQQRIRN